MNPGRQLPIGLGPEHSDILIQDEDFDRDGVPDLVVDTTAGIYLFRNNSSDPLASEEALFESWSLLPHGGSSSFARGIAWSSPQTQSATALVYGADASLGVVLRIDPATRTSTVIDRLEYRLPLEPLSSNPYHVEELSAAFHDVDGDGDEDIVAKIFATGSRGPTSLLSIKQWYRNDNDSTTFEFAGNYNGDVTRDLTVSIPGDWNGDEISDRVEVVNQAEVVFTQSSGGSEVRTLILSANKGNLSPHVDRRLVVSQPSREVPGDLFSVWPISSTGQATVQRIGVDLLAEQSVFPLRSATGLHVESTDVDDDGDVDFLSAHDLNNTVSWIESTPTGSRTHRITTGTDAYFGDLDGDSDVDAVVHQGQNVSAWFNQRGTFTSRLLWSDQALPLKQLATGDLNYDRLPDVAYYVGDQIFVRFQRPDTTWSLPIAIGAAATDVATLRVDTLDSLGRTAIVYAADQHVAIVSYDVATTQFRSLFNVPGGAIHVSDLDRNGSADVFVVNSEQAIDWYVADTATWKLRQTITTEQKGIAASALRSVDVDRDGVIDVVAMRRLQRERFDGSLSYTDVAEWYRVQPSLDANPLDFDEDTRGQRDIDDINAICRAIADNRAGDHYDLNEDGIVDLKDVDRYLSEIGSVIGDADLSGRFLTDDLVRVFQVGSYESQASGVQWSEGDWNCNGAFESGDILLAWQAGAFDVAISRITLGESHSYGYSSQGDPQFFDFDRDGDVDLYNSDGWYSNDGAQALLGAFHAFPLRTDDGLDLRPFIVTPRDLDHDLDVDLVISYGRQGSSDVYWSWLENRNGEYAAHPLDGLIDSLLGPDCRGARNPACEIEHQRVGIGDIDGDSHLDIVYAFSQDNGGDDLWSIHWFANKNGDGAFSREANSLIYQRKRKGASNEIVTSRPVDYEGDGDLDFFVHFITLSGTGDNGTSNGRWMINQGNGTFSAVQIYEGELSIDSIGLFDNRVSLEWIGLRDELGRVDVFANQRGQRFIAFPDSRFSHSLGVISDIVDFDHDGRADVVTFGVGLGPDRFRLQWNENTGPDWITRREFLDELPSVTGIVYRKFVDLYGDGEWSVISFDRESSRLHVQHVEVEME